MTTINLEIIGLIQHILKRPQMYAQNPGSLEDQVLLLLSLDPANLDRLPDEYLAFLYRECGTMNTPMAQQREGFEEVAELLKKFVVWFLATPHT